MGVNHTTGKQPLKPFRQFLPESLRGTRRGRASPNKMTEGIEAYDTNITDAASVIIGSELSVSARKALSDSFVNDIKKMCDGGRSIMAIAVALD